MKVTIAFNQFVTSLTERMPSGENSNVNVPVNWLGRIWGRTLCTTDSITEKFSYATGDCSSGKIACNGSGGSPPNTLVEFSLDGFNDIDFHDVSLVDGFNLPLIVVPISGSGSSCKSTGCMVDLNAVCPAELKKSDSKS
ncbi:PR5-like receptor kinase [Vigna umbellata]|uniref:PR5-like receptor kinase n=1 Tax=Vigna umbellata TaxID=87088 RepID=UPI001F5F6215|nr:PR5-like receptor kinase [Vigna umbellata]